MIDRATVERIKEAADIVEVVGEYVHLTRRGANYMGLCPFHNEKTPSFSVNRARNFCYCFSCKKGGSPVNFLMEKEGISYHDALLRLAQKYGIKVEERELTDKEREEQSEREAMFTANEWAMQKMQEWLKETDEGRDVGLQYLYGRGITAAAVDKFRLGYSFDKGTALSDAAVKAGYDIDVLKSTGLLGESQQGRTYDRFRGRVIYPVLNTAGKVVAFGGRDLKGQSPAKYINSPESAIYKKSRELYGIYQAKNSIVRSDKCFLVEGYMDVIGMWQSGVENVVASSGTALTEDQIALIHRFTKNVTLIYDGDAAGIKASLRGIDMLLADGMNVKVLLLPDGHDPDSFARQNTPEQFKAYLEEHETDIIRFKAQTLLGDTASDPQKRAAAVRSVVESVAVIADRLTRIAYVQECATIFGIDEAVLMSEVDRMRGEKNIESARKREHERIDREERQEHQQAPRPLQPKRTAQGPMTEEQVLYPLEEALMKYCVRYGMLPLIDTVDAEGNTDTLTVCEYISEEMRADDTGLTVPAFVRMFQEIKDMVPDFLELYADRRADFEREYESDLQNGFNEISQRELSMNEIEKAETALRERLDAEYEAKCSRWATSYVSDRMLSHEDDELRNLAMRLVTERHSLSKYHSKVTTVHTEPEMLHILVPRAVSEWKNGLLDVQTHRATERLREAAMRGNDDEVRACMEEVQRLNNVRSEFARFLGERVLSPTDCLRTKNKNN